MNITSLEAYKRYQLELNKLDTSDNIDISPGEFVIIFNKVQNDWFESKYKNVSSKYLSEIQNLVEPDHSLKKLGEKDSYVEFEIPENFFNYISSYSLADKDNCKGRKIYNREVKLANLNSYLQDEYNKPSFNYEETIITLGKDKVQVYKTDFDVISTFCTYYRYPAQIDIAGYTKLGVPSTTVDSDLTSRQVDEIIDLCVIETQRRYSDVEGFNLSQSRQ